MTKAQILEAVREAKGDDAADRIAGLKKPEMVTAAEELLEGSGWLPEPLRTQGQETSVIEAEETDADEFAPDGNLDAADTPDAEDEAPIETVEPVAAE